jgi:hypothetical protein
VPSGRAERTLIIALITGKDRKKIAKTQTIV